MPFSKVLGWSEIYQLCSGFELESQCLIPTMITVIPHLNLAQAISIGPPLSNNECSRLAC